MKLFGYNINIRKDSGQSGMTRQFRNYAGAKSGNMTADWLTSNLTADETIRWSLKQLRARSRDLAMNNDHMKNFLRDLKVNVVGPCGIGMQSKARTSAGDLDKINNKKVEKAWRTWSKKKNASVCGTQSFKDLCNTALETVARDGEVLIRKIRGYDNPFRFALQIIEADHLDEQLNRELPNGNRIVMGIEKDPFGKPVCYHIFKKHPGDTAQAGQQYVSIPADEIIHIFVKERPTQSRGVPWAHTALIRLRMLGAYDEAALVNARIGASKMQSIIKGENGSEFSGDAVDEYGNIIQEVEPGMREVLPYGTTIHDTNPAFPNGEHGTFTKAMLRGVSSGIGVSYEGLANDRENVNFSSIRTGMLSDRDRYKVIQNWFIENLPDDFYPELLDMSILSRQLAIPAYDTPRFADPRWQPRRWDWVDPEKDINARLDEYDACLTSLTRIAAEKGDDLEEILEERAEENKLLAAFGVEVKPRKTAQAKSVADDDNEPAMPSKNGNNGNNGRRN